ncbi:hypothetical protein F0L74_25785 [Chitinophaga agrisoli]|uniref:Uncharacterized protein n=1 Tax=Chitinophaga agrisoli TaxID=2607653 RepID=A0A5B2VM80_9BACT|nr:hypothetical protein [Chitinophaga agrisoli]KAA2239606.1 hypothetical protein F0L74_25785 [Chitinophaga agrisoli]
MANDQHILQAPEQLTFMHECLPQLMAGEYTISATVSVNVTGAQPGDFETATKNVWVGAPRFALEEAAVYAMYPPKDLTGHFETTLPQIVFNRRTLPWERTIDGAPHSTTAFRLNNPDRHAPWMALLLLSEDELKDTIRSKKSLQDPGTDVFIPEISKLAPWENIATEYDVIDIPLPLFKQVAPSKEDLPYLAHVRKVDVNESKDRAAIGDDGYFATLIGNRLPVRAADPSSALRNTVLLVSLEGYQNYFNTNQYIENKGKNKVRLVVLQSWSFTIAAGKNFRELCEGLHVSPFKMNYPAKTDDTLKQSYNYGYTLLPHITRNGAQTYSWYRGPFNPNFLPADPKTRIFKTADAALRFDHQTGLMDISYAAAWQLGRLLALKDKTFSTALYQWKLQGKRKVVNTAGQQQISNLFPQQLSAAATPMEEKMKTFLASHYNMEKSFDATPVPFTNDPAAIQQQLDNIAGSENAAPEIPQTITDWLGKLFLLEGVPVNYLIPHEDYLISREGDTVAKEAVGTFYIDYEWIEALLGGALSIVASDDSVALLNMLKDGRFLPANIIVNKKNAPFIPSGEGQAVPLPATITGHITGYFIRSQLIAGWKGIKIFAKDDTGAWMEHPLKIERLADDIQLCVFAGKVQQLQFIQPPEGIHFAVDANGNAYQKTLRDTAGNIGQTTVPLPCSNGVFDLKTIATAIAEKGTPALTSADLAFQLLESPIIYTLNIFDNWHHE